MAPQVIGRVVFFVNDVLIIKNDQDVLKVTDIYTKSVYRIQTFSTYVGTNLHS